MSLDDLVNSIKEKWLKEWHFSQSGNPTKQVDGVWITILQSKFLDKKYAISIDKETDWHYKYSSVVIAKIAAFDLFYSGYHSTENQVIKQIEEDWHLNQLAVKVSKSV